MNTVSVSTNRLTAQAQRDLNAELTNLLNAMKDQSFMGNPVGFLIHLIDRRSGDDKHYERIITEIDPNNDLIGEDPFFAKLSDSNKTIYKDILGKTVYLFYQYGFSMTHFRRSTCETMISIVDPFDGPPSGP